MPTQGIERQGQGRRTVIFYRAAHGASRCDLDKHLKGPHMRVELYANGPALGAGAVRNRDRHLQWPTAAIDLLSGNVVPREKYEKLGPGDPLLIDRTPSACEVR